MGIVTYIKESFEELNHKVTWISFTEAQKSTVVVAIFTVLFALLPLLGTWYVSPLEVLRGTDENLVKPRKARLLTLVAILLFIFLFSFWLLKDALFGLLFTIGILVTFSIMAGIAPIFIKAIKKYFADFSFKHPTPNDIKRSAEKVSGIHLDWYLNEWTQTTHTIDYGIKSVEGKSITLERIGQMPMPMDVEVIYTDGSKESFNIPLRMMRGNKPTSATVLEDWTWAHPTYTFATSKEVKSVEIDTSKLMADINLENNIFEVE